MDRSVGRSLRWAKAVFMPLALLFLAMAIYGSRATVTSLVAQARVDILLLSASMWALLLLVAPALSSQILDGLGSPTGYRKMLAIHIHRLPAKYLPGGVWHTVGRAADLAELGTDRKTLAALIYLENAVPLAVAVLTGASCLLANGEYRMWVPTLTMAALAGTAGAPLLLRWVVPGLPAISLRSYLSVLATTLLFWAIASMSFLAYLMAISSDGFTLQPLKAAGAYLLSWAAGFAVVFSPQGLGVFEATASMLLETALPFGAMALVVAGFRACMLAGESIGYLLFWALRFRRATAPRSD